MADSRTLKLTFLGDVSNLSHSLKTAEGQTDNFGNKVSDMGKKVGVALAAAATAVAAFATKLAIDGVKAAMEDEVAQQRLATTLKNVTGATYEQIGAVEAWITKTQLALGVSDTQLRPAFERLTRATKDVTKAQELTTLALDVSAGSGKSLEAVANALGKAYEGNNTALSKLGVGIDKAQLKTMSFEQITAQLAQTFEGQASMKADTFQGKLTRLSEAFSEAKETVGTYIIDALQPLLDLAVKYVIPAFQDMADKIGKVLSPVFDTMVENFRLYTLPMLKDLWHWFENKIAPTIKETVTPLLAKLKEAFTKVNDALRENQDELKPLIELFKWAAEVAVTVLIPIFGKNLINAIEALSTALVAVVNLVGYVVEKTVKNIEIGVNKGISAINLLLRAYNAIPFLGDVKLLDKVSFTTTASDIQAARELSSQVPRGVTTTTTSGVPVVPTSTTTPTTTKSTNTAATDSAMLQEYVTTANAINTSIAASVEITNTTLNSIMEQLAVLKNTPTTINVDAGVADPEGTARAIETVLYNSNLRTGSAGWVMA